MKERQTKHIVFIFLLALVVITLPFPKYNISSHSIILLLVYWLFYSQPRVKMKLLKENKKHFFLLSIPFWLAVLGSTYSGNFNESLVEIQHQLPFLIFPLIILTTPVTVYSREFIFRHFTYAVIIASVFAVIKAVYFYTYNLGDYFYYDDFGELLNKHTTYFALFVVVGMLYCLNEVISRRITLFIWIAIPFFILILYMLSVRISLIGLFIGSFILLFYKSNITLKWVAIMALPVLLLFYFTPHFQKRFDYNPIENKEISDMAFRKLHWKSVIETIQEQPLLFGVGTRGNRDLLYKKYEENELIAAVEEEYNAHNQFLEVLLDYGLIGFLFFMTLLFYIARSFIKAKDPFAISVFALFIIFMITESILVRHSGIVLFSFLISILIYSKSRVNINP